MIMSRACGYAVQAIIHVAKKPEGHFTPVRKISEELGIPRHFLGKIVQSLVKAGILSSSRGPKGGLALMKNPSELTLMDVVSVIDGTDFNTRCIIGLPKCDDEAPCILHSRWEKMRKGVLSGMSLAALVKELE
jgi:Rrf2 family protein